MPWYRPIPVAFAPGSTFERYTIEALLGRGGMGEVYLATDPRLRRKVAIKVVRDDETASGEATKRLRREARTAASLSHPNVVAVHDVGEVDGVSFIVMEYVRGESLLARAQRPEPIPIVLKLGWLAEVARALGSAHEAGVVHRDVKPSNIMISQDGVAKVVDFGLARSVTPAVAPASFRTLGDGILGTPTYMAPELLAGASADAASDQFAFGVTAYELLTGVRPARPVDSARLASEIAPEIPVEVARAVARTFAWDPSARFAKMGEIVEVLELARSELVAAGGTGKLDATLPDTTLPVETERDAALELAVSPTVESTLPLAPRTATKPLPPLAPRTRTAAMPPVAPSTSRSPPRGPEAYDVTAKVRRPAPARSRTPIVLASVAVACLLAGGALLAARGQLGGATATPPEAAVASTAAPASGSAAPEIRWRVPVEGAPSSGPREAPVTVVELCDVVSPSCKAAVAPVRALLARHEGRVRLVWRSVLLPERPRAEVAAALAFDAFATSADAGFWKAHDALLELPPRLEDADLDGLRKTLGLPPRSPQGGAGRHAARIDEDANLADDLQVTAVPAFFVDGRRVASPSPVEGLAKVVEEELALAQAGRDRLAAARDPFEPVRKVAPAVPAGSPTRGRHGARVVVQIWGDYGAPECQGVPAAIAALAAAHGDEVEIVWRDRPLSAESALAAEAAREAAAQKGSAAYWRMHERLFAAPSRLGRADLVAHARALGLDLPAFESALDKGTHKVAVEADVASARESGVAGTPAYLVNAYYLGGPQPARRLTRLAQRALGR